MNRTLRLALAVTLALVLVIFIPNTTQSNASSGGGSSPASQGVYSNFSFPYTYAHPAVPSSYGALGIQGPDVPFSSLGPQGQIGVTGHTGPVNLSGAIPWSPSKITVNLVVYNGTVTSRSLAIGNLVELLNVTNGKSLFASTDTSGSASFSVTPGWYLLQVTAGNGYIDFTQMINLPVSMSLTRYLIPSSYGYIDVSNGPSGASWASVYMEQPTSPFGTGSYAYLPQLTVELINVSGGDTVLSKGYTLSNGTVSFNHVNRAYSYAFLFEGFVNDLSGVKYSISNYTESFTIGGGTFIDTSSLNLGGKSSTTGSVVGTALTEYAANGYSWDLTSNTVVTGGSTYISQKLQLNSYTLEFVNSVVYFNESQSGSGGSQGLSLYFTNSTIIILTNLNDIFGDPNNLHATGVHFDNCVIYAANKSVPLSSQPVSILSNHVTNSAILGYVALAGTFFNDLFIQVQSTGVPLSAPNALVKSSSIEESPLFSPAASTMTAFSNDVISDNSSVSISSMLGYYNNSNISYTIPPHNSGNLDFGGAQLYATGINLTFVAPTSMNLISYYSSLNPFNFNTGKVNISKSIMIFNRQPKLPSINMFSGGSSIHMYDDYINENYSLPQLSQWTYNAIASDHGDTPTYVNYTTIATGGLFSFSGNNLTFSHDYFTDMNEVNADTFQSQLFGNLKQPGVLRATYTNDSWGYIYVNFSLTARVTPHTYDGPGQLIEDMNVEYPPANAGPAYLNVSHNTFHPFFAANTSAYTNTAPVDVLLGEGAPNNVIANISWNVFENNASYTTGPNSGQTHPYFWDIVIWGGTGYIYNNYFLNLNEQVIPIGGNNNESGPQGWAGRFQIVDNHFFYYPAKGENRVPIYPYTDAPVKNWVPGGSITGPSQVTYQLPVYYNSTLTVVKGGNFIFNTSYMVKSIPMYNGVGYWVWNISPDVSIINGTPVVAYSFGLNGGPQPNFTWNGSRYQIAVEPNMTYIASQSRHASRIGIQFQVPVGLGLMEVWMHNSSSGENQLVTTVAESGAPSTVTVTYDPSSMPSNTIFFTNTTTGYQATFKEVNLPSGTSWSVTLGDVTSTSSSSSITFAVQNGSYHYSISQLQDFHSFPVSGTVLINGTDASLSVVWAETTYLVGFAETGLTGQNWSVTLNGLFDSSNYSQITFQMQNGTYPYSVYVPAGYRLNDTAGNVTVNGSSIVISLAFNNTNSSQVGNPIPTPPTPPPPTNPTGPVNPGPTSSTGSGRADTYKQLIVEMVALALAPSLVLTLYMAIHLVDERKPKTAIKRKKLIKFKRLR